MSVMSTLVTQLGEHAKRLARDAQPETLLKDANVQPKAALYAVLFLATFTWSAILVTRLFPTSRPNTPSLEKRCPFNAPDRPPGTWRPSPFTRPHASPHPNWSLTATKPVPYRAFRHGPRYNITMGLRNMPWDEWIQLDNEYLRYHSLKAARIAERGPRCVRTAPEAVGAAEELLAELVEYLPQRYPGLFREVDMGHGKGMENLVTGEVFDVGRCERNGGREDPMEMCARMIQDDLAIMVERGDGLYYLLAGAILLAGFWRLEDKFGMPLSAIHTSGDVPGFKDKLEKPMTSFFRRIQPQSPVVRNNYFIQVDDKLAWSESIGSEDAKEEEEGGIGWFTAEKNKAVEHHWFRSERQSLRRLPKSGGVVFTIRTYFHPITDIAQERHVPGRLASAIRSWGEDVSRYKGKEMYGDVLLEYLDGKHAEQVAAGLDVEAEENVARGYPF